MDEEERKLAERRRVMMNDLSRLRQEELPLSNKESRGPSYAPTRKNGTDHIPPEEKAILKSQWDVEFDDDEARQCEGLAMEDARLYAKTGPFASAGNPPNCFADPGRAPICFQFPDSAGKSKMKKKKARALSLPPSAPSEAGSIASSKPSWSARRAYAVATQVQNPGPFPKPSSRVSRSVIASANDFLNSAIKEVPKLKENLPTNNARKATLPDIPKSSITSEPNEAPAVQKPNGASLAGDPIPLAVQPPVTTLIDVGGESELLSEANGEGMSLLGVLEANNLLEIVRGCVPDLVEGRMDEKTWDPNMQVALRTVLGGLVILKESMQKREAVRSSTPQRSHEVMESTMAELMELVESNYLPMFRYSPSELLKLRRLGRLRREHEAAVEETKREKEAFSAVRRHRDQNTASNISNGEPEAVAAVAEERRVVVKTSPEATDAQGVDTPPSEETADPANETDNSVHTLAHKAANWTLDDMPEIRGLARSYWAADRSKQDPPLFVLPPKHCRAVEIKAEVPAADEETMPEVKVSKSTVEEVMRALALLDAEDEKSKRERRQLKLAKEGPSTPTHVVVSKEVTPAKKGLASSMWA